MGSDDGLKYRMGNKNPFQSLFSFLAGCVVSYVLLTTVGTPSSLRRSSSVGTTSSTDCRISFGTYRGHEYTTETGGTVGSPQCLVESKFLKVQQHHVRMPPESSNVIDDWLWIDYHDRINVLVEAPKQDGDEERHFLVFDQTKYALEGRQSHAIVGGIIEPGEEPLEAAKREVEEEMGGIHCTQWIFLGRFRTDVNRGMGWTNSYLALDCHKGDPLTERHLAQQQEEVGGADTERQDLRRIGLSELRKAATAGQFLEIQWSATVAFSLLYPELS